MVTWKNSKDITIRYLYVLEICSVYEDSVSARRVYEIVSDGVLLEITSGQRQYSEPTVPVLLMELIQTRAYKMVAKAPRIYLWESILRYHLNRVAQLAETEVSAPNI